MGFQPTTRLDRVFEVGIILKGLDGLLEIAGGILLLVIRPGYLNHLATLLTQHELAEDPRDFVATHILHSESGRWLARICGLLPAVARHRQVRPGVGDLA